MDGEFWPGRGQRRTEWGVAGFFWIFISSFSEKGGGCQREKGGGCNSWLLCYAQSAHSYARGCVCSAGRGMERSWWALQESRQAGRQATSRQVQLRRPASQYLRALGYTTLDVSGNWRERRWVIEDGKILLEGAHRVSRTPVRARGQRPPRGRAAGAG